MRFLNNLTIQRKLLILLALSAVALVVATLAAALLLHDRMMEERVAKLRAVVEMTYGAASGLDTREKAGEFGHDEALKRFRDAVHSEHFEGSNYIFVHDLNGINLAHGADPKEEGTDLSQKTDSAGTVYVQDMIAAAKSPAGEGLVHYVYPRAGGMEPLPKIGYIKKFGPWNALIGAGAYVDDIDAAFWRALATLSGVSVAVLAVLALAGLAISRNIARPLAALQIRMEDLATGNLAVEILDSGRRDEVGGMTRAVVVFKENALAVRHLQAEQEAMKHEAAAQKTREMQALADSFDRNVGAIVDRLSAASAEMETTARSMSGTAQRTKEGVLAAATVSHQNSANVQTVAGASEELSKSIAEIGARVSESTRIVSVAAETGQRTNITVESLAAAAQKIGQVVALINQIASQTNLLALNATIEAARAGDAGKGFAVVASEVKSLATQTTRATDDIRAQIGAIQAETQEAVAAIRDICRIVIEVNEISTSIASAVEQQDAATQEIARSVHQAATGTDQVLQNITAVSDVADEAGAAAERVLGAAGLLSAQSAQLRGEVERFLGMVRAG